MSAIRHDQTRGHIERGGLTGTVGTQQTHNLTLLHVEAHIVDHRTLAVLLDEALGTQHQLPLRLHCFLCFFHIRVQRYTNFETQSHRDTEFFVFLLKFSVSLWLCVEKKL